MKFLEIMILSDKKLSDFLQKLCLHAVYEELHFSANVLVSHASLKNQWTLPIRQTGFCP